MKQTVLLRLVFCLCVTTFFLIGNRLASAVDDQDIGLPIYPGATQDSAYTPMNTPYAKNLHLVCNDSYKKVVEWYSSQLGKFRETPSNRGDQALWQEKTPDGGFRTVTISTINAPSGQVKITLTKGNLKR